MTMDPSTPGQTGDMNVTAYPTDRLRPYHRNPRRGNIAVIAESLKTLGQYRPIVVNAGTHTGRPDEVLAGNHTLLAARELGWVSIDGVTVDVDEDTAARIVLVDNRSTDLASNDDEVLAELLTDLPDLSATGYEKRHLEDLLDALRPADDEEWAEAFDRVPDGEQRYFSQTFTLNPSQAEIVERALDTASRELDGEGGKAAALTAICDHYNRARA